MGVNQNVTMETVATQTPLWCIKDLLCHQPRSACCDKAKRKQYLLLANIEFILKILSIVIILQYLSQVGL